MVGQELQEMLELMYEINSGRGSMEKNKKSRAQEEIIERVYNLILDSTISVEERQYLVDFKNNINNGATWNHNVDALSKQIMWLQVKGEASKTISAFKKDLDASMDEIAPNLTGLGIAWR